MAAFQINAFQLFAFQTIQPVDDFDPLVAAKSYLRVIHNDDDAMLTRLISAAVREYLAFINYEISSELSSEETIEITDDAFQGIILIIQCDYEGNLEKRDVYRKAAETLWMPYRISMGI